MTEKMSNLEEDEIAFSGFTSTDWRKIASCTVIAEGKSHCPADIAELSISTGYRSRNRERVNEVLATIPHTRNAVAASSFDDTYISISVHRESVPDALAKLKEILEHNVSHLWKCSDSLAQKAIGTAGANAIANAEKVVEHQAALTGHKIHSLLKAQHLTHYQPTSHYDSVTNTINWTVPMAVTFRLQKI